VTDKAGDDKDPLVSLAREAIESYIRESKGHKAFSADRGEPRQAGTFVSLHLPDGSLRAASGPVEPCRGSMEEEIVANAISAPPVIRVSIR